MHGELENIIRGYAPVTKVVPGFFNSIEALLKSRAGYRVREYDGVREYVYDREEARRIIRDRGRAIFLGDVGIGKTSIVLQEAIKLANKLGKEYVMINELLARYGKEKLTEMLNKMAENPEKYFFISFVSLGMSAREELTGIPLLELNMPLPHIAEATMPREAYGLEDKGFISAAQRAMELVKLIDTSKKITRTPVTLPTLPLSLDILSKSGIWGILIIDDITNHKRDEDLMNFISSVMGHRRISGISSIELSPYVMIVGTGNLRQHSELAYDLPPNIAGRVAIYCVGMPAVTDFKKYMLRQASRYRVNKRILSLIFKLFDERSHLSGRVLTGRKKEEYQNAMDTPRAWERFLLDASLWIEAYESLGERKEENNIISEDELKLIIRNIFIMTVGREDLVNTILNYLFTKTPSFLDIVNDPKEAYRRFQEEFREDVDALFGYGVEVGMGIESIVSKYIRPVKREKAGRQYVTIVFSNGERKIGIDEAKFIKAHTLKYISETPLEELESRAEELYNHMLEENIVYRDLIHGREDDRILGRVLVDFAGLNRELIEVVLNILWVSLRENIVNKLTRLEEEGKRSISLAYEILAAKSFLISAIMGPAISYTVRMKRSMVYLKNIAESTRLVLTL